MANRAILQHRERVNDDRIEMAHGLAQTALDSLLFVDAFARNGLKELIRANRGRHYGDIISLPTGALPAPETIANPPEANAA